MEDLDYNLILQKLIYYSKFVDWVNLIYLFTFLIYILFWLTFFSRWHWRSNSFFEYIFRIIAVIPFWLLFLFHGFSFFKPVFIDHDSEPYVKQSIKLINNSDADKNYSVYQIKDGKFLQSYEHSSFYLDPEITVLKEDGSAKFTFAFDTSISKSFLIKEIGKVDSLKQLTGKYFQITGVEKIIYTNNLSEGKVQNRQVFKTYQIELFVTFVIAFLGSWYYIFVVVKPSMKKRAAIFGVITTLINAYIFVYLMNFYLVQDIFRIKL